jgi:hypothetical protein
MIAAVVITAVIVYVVYFYDADADAAVTGQIPFDEGRDTIVALADNCLVTLSPTRFVMHNRTGRELISRAVSFETPALAVAGGKVIAYDRSGRGAFVAESGAIREELDIPVLTAAGNARGQFILVTSESGYRSVAQLYDNRNRLTYKWYSAERYIVAASLSPSGRRMAVASVGQHGETVAARITFLEPGSAEPLGFADIGGEFPLAIYSPDNNHVCVLTEFGVYFYTDSGEYLGHYPFGGLMPLSVQMTDQAVFLQLGRNARGQHSRLICISYTGAELGGAQFMEGPDAFIAEGRRCAVLEAGGLTRFSLDGTELTAEHLGLSGARNLLLSQEGGILLLYSGYAEWYNEERAPSDGSED